MAEMPSPLASAAETRGEGMAIVAPGAAVNYRDYNARVSAAAARLRAAGLEPGDRVGLVAPLSTDYLIALMGCFRARVVACPINTRLPDAAVETALDLVGCLAVAGQAVPGRQELDLEQLASDIGDQAPPPPLDPGQPAAVVFTSGSTGRPKAALLAYGNFHANAEASNRNIPLAPDDRWLLSLPLYHVSGLGVAFRCLVAGAAVVVPDPGEDLAEAVERYGVTHVSLVTTQLHRLLERPEGVRALSRLKAILLGGSGMPPRLLEQALVYGLPIRTSYGMTETASQVATTTAEDRTLDALRRARPIIPGTVRISPEGGVEVSGPTRFMGYLSPEGLETPFTDDGWFATGDLGRLDGEGRLTILGRRDNVFISGGENVQPEEIERELCSMEGVEGAVVVPVPHEEYGMRPVAFVKTRPGSAIDADALRAALGRRLPRFKVPDAFYPWPAELDRPEAKIRREDFIRAAQRARTP